jgi:hypothetical protein
LELEDVFRKTNVAILEVEHNLDLLSGPLNAHAGLASSESPSWMTCWTITDAPHPLTYQHVGRDPQFQASAGSQSSPRFLEDQRILEVAGFIFDTIICVGQPAIQMQTPTGPFAQVKALSRECYYHKLFLDWERVAEARSRRRYPNGEDMIDAYWQTLIGGFTTFTDLNTDWGNPEADAMVFYKGLFQKWDRDHRSFLYLHKALHWLPGVDYICCGVRSLYSLGWALLYRIGYIFGRRMSTRLGPQFSTYNHQCAWRRIFRTERGYIGLAPRFAEVGDKVAILKGGRVAYVLRSVSNRWRLLGDAYVHGIMRGEAFKEDSCEPILLE